jgi:hypothetical protein
MRAKFGKEIHVTQHSRTKFFRKSAATALPRNIQNFSSAKEPQSGEAWSLRRSQPLVKEQAVDFAIGKIKTLPLINNVDADGKEFPFLFRSALSVFISGEIFLFDTRHTLEC